MDVFVEALHLGNRVRRKRVPMQMLFPSDDEFAELRAPIADMVVRDDAMAEKP